VDGRHAARRSAGGGGRIPATRTPVARLATAAVAVAIAGALTAGAALSAGRYWALPAALGTLGVALLLLSLAAGWPSLLPWAVVALASAYASGLAVRDDPGVADGGAPLYGAGLLLVAELGYWSLDLRGSGREERRLLLRRAAALAALAFASVVLGAIVLSLTAVELGGGVVLDAVGVAAAAAALVLIVRLAQRELAERR
jgi:hypothetical protein